MFDFSLFLFSYFLFLLSIRLLAFYAAVISSLFLISLYLYFLTFYLALRFLALYAGFLRSLEHKEKSNVESCHRSVKGRVWCVCVCVCIFSCVWNFLLACYAAVIMPTKYYSPLELCQVGTTLF